MDILSEQTEEPRLFCDQLMHHNYDYNPSTHSVPNYQVLKIARQIIGNSNLE